MKTDALFRIALPLLALLVGYGTASGGDGVVDIRPETTSAIRVGSCNIRGSTITSGKFSDAANWTSDGSHTSPQLGEIWDLPERGLVQLNVPRSAQGEGRLKVFVRGVPLPAQEVPGAGCCVVDPDDALRRLSRKESVDITFVRDPVRVPQKVSTSVVTVSNAVFAITFDAKKKGGLPSRIVWASGKRAECVGWGDRIFDSALGVRRLDACTAATVEDLGTGPIFRHVRTVAWFQTGKRRAEGEPKAVYDWLFFNAHPEWVWVGMRFTSAGGTKWAQVHSGQIEFPFADFTDGLDMDRTGKASRRKLLRNGTSKRSSSPALSALVNGRDFAAVYGCPVCIYSDHNRKVDYLHASYGTAYDSNWDGDALSRTAIFRFGSADDVEAALRAPQPIRTDYGCRIPVDVAACERTEPGETSHELSAGGLRVLTSVIRGTRAAIKRARVNGETVAVGPQRLFAISVEDVESSKSTELTSLDDWTSVTATPQKGGLSWRFTGPKAMPSLPSLTVTVTATPAGDGGIDWTFKGSTGSGGHALAEAAIGELTFLCSGRGMRGVWPGCMGEKALVPCRDKTNFSGRYPSMHCVMPWQAVWDESRGRCFAIAALDPAGGAKIVRMKGRSAEATVNLSLRHLLSWDGGNPGAPSAMSGTIAWRAMAGDWYEAALFYRDWVREHAAWHPKMGPEGRLSTPMWFKKLGYIVKTHGSAESTEKSVRLSRAYLDVPVMAHWYGWFPGVFDNDYPNYYPPNPDVIPGVRRLHEAGAHAVPYTNGHIWDMHDRGAEDWRFTKCGAYGACRKPDGSILTERYSTVETNGQPVVFAAMCPASKTWHDKVVENAGHVVNDCGFDGYYMDQVGAFSTCICRNPEHGHPFGGGSWWQSAYRRLLKDARARCAKPVFLATEGNAEHTLDQIDAFVCWNIPGGIDTVPAFEVCYSGATTVYCRSPGDPAKDSREMRMKLANTLVDGDMFGWMPVSYCQAKELNAYFRACVRFRHKNGEWFYLGEMRRPPELLDAVPEWNETWSLFGKKRLVKMPIVQTAARRILEYDYDAAGNRLWKTGRVTRAFVYFTNFSPDETAVARVRLDAHDLGIDIDRAEIVRIDAEGVRTPFPREALDKPFVFAPDACFGLEFRPRP